MKRSEIDSFESGRHSPAKCELFVMWLREDEPPRPLVHTVHLKGAEPTYFNIVLDPNQQGKLIVLHCMPIAIALVIVFVMLFFLDLPPVRHIDTVESVDISPDAYTEIGESNELNYQW